MSENPTAPAPAPVTDAAPAPVVPSHPVTAPAPHTAGGKVLLAVTAALFVGWLGWLGYTALTKSREPIVSRAQAAGASVPVHAKISAAEPDKESMLLRPAANGGQLVTVLKGQADKPAFVVEVVEKLNANGPEAGTTIGVTNLPACAGFTGPGEYLLLLTRDGEATIDGRPAFTLVGQQRSPGADLEGVGPPVIYRWGPDVGKQVQRLFP